MLKPAEPIKNVNRTGLKDNAAQILSAILGATEDAERTHVARMYALRKPKASKITMTKKEISADSKRIK